MDSEQYADPVKGTASSVIQYAVTSQREELYGQYWQALTAVTSLSVLEEKHQCCVSQCYGNHVTGP